MISNTLGAPLGGTTDGGQYGLESFAVSLITPPNFGGAGGSCFPSIVVVALGEPGVPVICCAFASNERTAPTRRPKDKMLAILIMLSPVAGCSTPSPGDLHCFSCAG